ncbi:hypothetical protein GCM10009665_07300 [Kitasatospora nipponensis]|uniref:Superfamily III holin-X n=1 Tax=Kitasatospora nipponensis TaxID=258049 RepID=A0ABN1VQG2_9ACTN
MKAGDGDGAGVGDEVGDTDGDAQVIGSGRRAATVVTAVVLSLVAGGLLVLLGARFGWHLGFAWLAAKGVAKAAVAVPVAALAVAAWWRARRSAQSGGDSEADSSSTTAATSTTGAE